MQRVAKHGGFSVKHGGTYNKLSPLASYERKVTGRHEEDNSRFSQLCEHTERRSNVTQYRHCHFTIFWPCDAVYFGGQVPDTGVILNRQ